MCPFQPLIFITGNNKIRLFLTNPKSQSLFLRPCFSPTSLPGMIANSSYRLSSQLKSETTFSRKKNVLGPDGTPTGNQDILGTVFPLVRPNWDPNSYAGKEAFTNYRWILLKGV
jgi:hypothetical protein